MTSRDAVAPKYRTMQEIAHDTIRDAILSGRLVPGQRVVTDATAI